MPPAPTATDAPPPTTASRASRALGLLSLAGLVLLLLFALVWSPADEVQLDAVRIVYAHVGIAIWAFGGCGITTVASAMWLWRKSEGWWVLGGAAAEVATVFTGLTLIVGSIYARPTWGTYWTWDPRLTSTALLFVMLVGFLALRRVDSEAGEASRRGVRAAIVGLLLFPNVLIVHFSVDWWRSLHQTSTITRLNPTIRGSMLFTMVLGIIVFGLVFAWLLIHRFRLGWLEERSEERGLDQALVERRAEAGVAGGVA
jgi:heme exporter protein C